MGLYFSKQVYKDIQDETKEIQEKLLGLLLCSAEGSSFHPSSVSKEDAKNTST
jgi:hypothetical protein